eukprot:ANDGO_01301.mRNA.1 Vegetative incompatibility protein HET-E-1
MSSTPPSSDAQPSKSFHDYLRDLSKEWVQSHSVHLSRREWRSGDCQIVATCRSQGNSRTSSSSLPESGYKYSCTVQCGTNSDVLCVAFSPSGTLIAAGLADHSIEIWELIPSKRVHILAAHKIAVCTLSISEDEQLVVSSYEDGTLKFWKSGRCFRTISAHVGRIRGLCFSQGFRSVVSCGQDKLLKVWNISDGVCTQTHRDHVSEIKCVAGSRSGDVLVTGSVDGVIILWRAGKCANKLQMSSGHPCAIDIDTEGASFTIVASNGLISMYDLVTLNLKRSTKAVSEAVAACAISNNGCRVALGTRDDCIEVWNEAEYIQGLHGSSVGKPCFAFTPDGKWFASSYHAGRIKIWNFDLEADAGAASEAEGPCVLECFRGPRLDCRAILQEEVEFAASPQDGLVVGLFKNEGDVIRAFVIAHGVITWQGDCRDMVFETSSVFRLFPIGDSSVPSLVFGSDSGAARTTSNASSSKDPFIPEYVKALEDAIDRLFVEVSFTQAFANDGVTTVIPSSLVTETVNAREKSMECLRLHSQVSTFPNGLINGSSIVKGDLIAHGGHCSVHRAELSGGHAVALKIPILHERESNFADSVMRLRNEYEALKTLSDPNVIRAIGLVHDPHSNVVVGMVQQLCLYGDLGRFMRRQHAASAVTEALLLSVALQAASGLAAIHTMGFRHRDVNPSNFMVCPNIADDAGVVIKVGDLGIADFSEYNTSHTLPIGMTGSFSPTLRYAAPEALSSEEFSEFETSISHDLWGFGHVLYECATGKVPFHGASDMHVPSKILKHETPEWPSSASLCVPQWLVDIAERCWTADPRARLRHFPNGMSTIVEDLCRAQPSLAKKTLFEVSKFHRCELRDIFLSSQSSSTAT